MFPGMVRPCGRGFPATGWRLSVALGSIHGRLLLSSFRDILRDAIVLAGAFGIAWLCGPELVRDSLMSADNTKDTAVWIIITLAALGGVLVVVFVAHLLFIAPYRLWMEAKGASRSLGQDEEVNRSVSEGAYQSANASLQSAQAENRQLRAELASAIEHRNSAARIMRLNLASRDVKEWIEGYRQAEEKVRNYISDGNFNQTMGNTFSTWYDVIKPAIGQMDLIRGDFRRVMNDLLGEDFDFYATPSLTNNPYSVNPPNIDRLPRDEFKYEYKRAWERIRRTEEKIKELPRKLEIAIKREEQKIARSDQA
jgi:hypothetical protein